MPQGGFPKGCRGPAPACVPVVEERSAIYTARGHPTFLHTMNEPDLDGDRALAVLRWWALGIVPLLLVLPMYIFPVTIGEPIGAYDGRRFLELVWATVLALALLFPRIRAAAATTWIALPTAVRGAAVGFLLIALASALLASAPLYALRGWTLLVLLGVTALSLTVVVGPIRWKALEVVGLTVLLYSILIFPDPAAHGFANPRFQGQVLAVLVPAMLFSNNLPLALMAAPAVAVGTVNGSRALILTLLVITCAMAVLWSDRRARMAKGLAGLALGAFLLGLLLWTGQGDGLAHAAERVGSSGGRIELWLKTLGQFAEAPLLGLGPEMLARAADGQHPPAHPHNTVLLILAETGIAGLTALAVIGVSALRSLPSLPPNRRPWAVALLAGGFHSLLSGTVIMPASQTMLVLAAAMCLPAAAGDTGRTSSLTRTGWVLTILGLVAVLGLASTLSLPASDIPDRQRPRFFITGTLP